MPQRGWRSRRAAPAVTVGAVVIGVSAMFIVVGIRNQAASDVAALPPIMPTADAPYASSGPEFRVPARFTAADDARARIPLSQPEVHWVFADGPNLPPLVSPCGGYLPSDRARVGAHQLALTSPTIWKLSRIVVYRDADAARQAMDERRSALERCAHHDDGNGIATAWLWQPLEIGDEAIAVGSQRYRGSTTLPGHQRGVVMRQARTLVMYVDFGQSRTPPSLQEIESYATVARAMADKLAWAPWDQ